MATKIEIVNKALTNFGHRRVDSLSVSNPITRAVNAVYNIKLELTLTKLNWSFARLQAKLALLAQTEDGVQPIDGWGYLYAQPAKCLKARFVFPQGGRYKARVEDFAECLNPANQIKALAADVQDAYCEFTTKIEDTTQFDAPFVEAFAAAISDGVCLDLTKDKQLAAGMAKLAMTTISEAARLNVRRSRDKKQPTSSFIQSRA